MFMCMCMYVVCMYVLCMNICGLGSCGSRFTHVTFTAHRSKLERNKDRDVSEKIALGMPSGPPSQDSLFDQRLFNQSKVSSGCVATHQPIVIVPTEGFISWPLASIHE